MSDQPLTRGVLTQVLVEFHRTIVLPDIERVVGESESRLRNEMRTFHDEVVHRLVNLESEYHLLTVGLARVEERLDRMDARFKGFVGQLESLEGQYQELVVATHRLEERLSRVEGQLDEAAATREKDPLRGEVADLRARVEVLQLQVRNLEKRFDR